MKFYLPFLLVGFITLGGCGESKQSNQEQAEKPQQRQAKQQDKKELNVPTEPPPGLEVGFEIGMIAPEIEAEDIDGQIFKLSDYRGKVVVLDFWGDW